MSDNYKKYVSGYSEAGCKYDVPTREFFENIIPLVKCYQFENKVILKDNPTKVNEYSLNDEYELRASSNNYDLQVNGHSVKLPTDYFSDRKRYIRFKFKEIKDDDLYCWIDGNETIIPFFRLKIEDVAFINFDEVYKVNHNFEGVAYIEKGESAKITGATASVDGASGTPSVNVTSGGTALERSFNFSFSGLKGEKGDKGDTGGLTNITQELGSQTDYVISQKVVTDNLNLKVNKSDIVNTHVGMSTVYPMTQSAVKNNFWNVNPIDNEVGPSKPAVSNRLWKTGLYVTVPTDNTSIPPAWNPNYDPCPGGTGYGSLLNLVNNGGASGSFRQQVQLYFADTPKNLYWRFDFNGQNHSDTVNWGSWKRLVNYDEISSGVKLTNSNSSSITFNRIDYPDRHGMIILTGIKEFVAGQQTWTLPQTMKNASYRILLNPYSSSEPSSSYYIPNIYNQTMDSCMVYSSKKLVYAYAIICTW